MESIQSGMPLQIAWLIIGHLAYILNKKERKELDAWLLSSTENISLFEALIDGM